MQSASEVAFSKEIASAPVRVCELFAKQSPVRYAKCQRSSLQQGDCFGCEEQPRKRDQEHSRQGDSSGHIRVCELFAKQFPVRYAKCQRVSLQQGDCFGCEEQPRKHDQEYPSPSRLLRRQFGFASFSRSNPPYAMQCTSELAFSKEIASAVKNSLANTTRSTLRQGESSGPNSGLRAFREAIPRPLCNVPAN
jgi:hypothetical protein